MHLVDRINSSAFVADTIAHRPSAAITIRCVVPRLADTPSPGIAEITDALGERPEFRWRGRHGSRLLPRIACALETTPVSRVVVPGIAPVEFCFRLDAIVA